MKKPIECEDAVSRDFVELVIEYPTTCAYPEYKGKPYYSIKYRENGQEYIGYGTYKPEVLSQYLKEYFIPSVTQKSKTGHWIVRDDLCSVRYYQCSECNEIGFYDTDFCPNCGAKMEG